MDLPDGTENWHHTPEEATRVAVAEKQPLSDYLIASVALIKSYLDQVKEEQLLGVTDKNQIPPATRQMRLVSVVDDVVMHSGQAVYTRELVIGK